MAEPTHVPGVWDVHYFGSKGLLSNPTKFSNLSRSLTQFSAGMHREFERRYIYMTWVAKELHEIEWRS